MERYEIEYWHHYIEITVRHQAGCDGAIRYAADVRVTVAPDDAEYRAWIDIGLGNPPEFSNPDQAFGEGVDRGCAYVAVAAEDCG